MTIFRLPRINDFDDPDLIPKVIIPLQEAAADMTQEELAEKFLLSIYGYVNARCRAHVRKLANKGITNISYENISSEVNWRLARSLYGIEWDRSPKEIKIYVVQQINFGLKEADRMSGRMTRREHKHINTAATLISKREQAVGRMLSRQEVEQVIRETIKDTSKTKWSEIALQALDPGEGITKSQSPSEGNALDAQGGTVFEVEAEHSAEETWFANFRFDNLSKVIREWAEQDIDDESIRSGLIGWLDDQQEPESGPVNKARQPMPPRVFNSISPYEKKRLLERCDEAGMNEIRSLLAPSLAETIRKAEQPKQMRLPM